MTFYERHILPRIIDCGTRAETIQAQREKVVPMARGTVLELGIGSGLNLRYYDPAKVERVIGVEPSAELREMIGRRAKAVGFPVEVIAGAAEAVPLPDASVDTVLFTYTLCTIGDAGKALGEVRRILRPTGRIVFSEHGLAPDAGVARWQGRINPLWKRLFGGCHLNRPITGLIEAAGFRLSALTAQYLPDVPRIAGYNYWGEAVPER